MTKRYVLIDTDDANPSDIDFELGPIYETDAAPSSNSYVTNALADALLLGHPSGAAFIALGDDAKSWYLSEATRHIDSLPLRGSKYDTDIIAGVPVQALEFPRIIDGETLDWNDSTDLAIVPDLVKRACLEEALAIYQQGTGGRRDLQQQGVQSFSIGGKLSETFKPGAGTETMQSAKARQLMRRYTGAETR